MKTNNKAKLSCSGHLQARTPSSADLKVAATRILTNEPGMSMKTNSKDKLSGKGVRKPSVELVTPAKAGVHIGMMDSHFRGNDLHATCFVPTIFVFSAKLHSDRDPT